MIPNAVKATLVVMCVATADCTLTHLFKLMWDPNWVPEAPLNFLPVAIAGARVKGIWRLSDQPERRNI